MNYPQHQLLNVDFKELELDICNAYMSNGFHNFDSFPQKVLKGKFVLRAAHLISSSVVNNCCVF